MTRALSERISKLLPFIINEDQTCNVKGRTIHHNTALIRDIIDFSNDQNINAYILSIDQMKAFDRVDWNFMFKTLKRFNFGENFIQWVKLAYTDITSKIKVNGFISDGFALERGVRQGCPLSAPLYIITAEILAIAIRLNPEIKGIQIEDIESKLSQYADDTTLTLTGDGSIPALQRTTTQYEQASGARVHPGKCKGLWLGSNRGRTDSPAGYEWLNSHLKLLGLHFGHGDLNKLNWKPRIESYTKILNMWRQRDLSMKGKRIVLSQLALSKLVYAAHTFPCPGNVSHDNKFTNFNRNYLQEIHDCEWKFFWGGKKTRIDQNIITLPVREGGMAVADISRRLRSIRLSTIAKLFNNEIPGKWKILARYQLNKIRGYQAGENIFKTFIPTSNLSVWGVSEYYRTLINDWVKLTNNKRPQPEVLEDILNEPIYQNGFITYANKDSQWPKPLAIPNWHCKTAHNSLTLIKNLCYEVIPGFHTLEQIQELTQHNITNAQLERITDSIPPLWRHKIETSTTNANTNNLTIFTTKNKKKEKKNVVKMNSKEFYSNLRLHTTDSLRLEKINTHFYTDWERKTGPVNWQKVFRSMYNNHTNKHITDVQYKLIHFGLATRKRLFDRRSKTCPQQSAMCTRCGLCEENGEHIFLNCRESNPVWLKAQSLIAAVAPNITPNKNKHIVAGYVDTKIPTIHVSVAEDIRLCYFQTIWTCRNKSLYENAHINSLPFFTSKLRTVIEGKHKQAVLENDLPNFLEGYGNCKIFQIRNNKIVIT